MQRILTTIGNLGESYPERGLEIRKLPRLRRRTLLRQLIALAPEYDASLLFGAAGFREGYVDLLAAGLIGRRGRPVVLTECYWETSSRSLSRMRKKGGALEYDATPASSGTIAKRLVGALDSDQVHYCVLSREEEAAFPGRWGISPSRVHFTAFGFTLPPADDITATGNEVFAGGNSLRDYRALIEVAPALPAPVVIATTLIDPKEEGRLRLGPLSSDAYDRALRAARIVVVPLRSGTTRSAGQQTYLSAMALRKPVIVTDSPGVRDYIRDGATGMIVPPNDPQKLSEALRWALDDANAADVEAMVDRAQTEVFEHFTLAAYHGRVLDVVGAVLNTHSGSRRAG